MGSIQNKEYYDGYYKLNKGHSEHFSKSEYKPLWDKVVEIIKADNKGGLIVDVGCGTGQFTNMLQDAGIIDVENYIGIDFSIEAIRAAMDTNPCLKFKCIDFFDAEILNNPGHGMREKIDLILCMETLEHIDDLKLLDTLKGKMILFTVPDFDAPAHIRHFKTIKEVEERYIDLIEFDILEQVGKYYIGMGVIIDKKDDN